MPLIIFWIFCNYNCNINLYKKSKGSKENCNTFRIHRIFLIYVPIENYVGNGMIFFPTALKIKVTSFHVIFAGSLKSMQ